MGRLALAHRRALCLVGGSVRDLVLRETPRDWDVVVDGPAEELVRAAAEEAKAGVISHPAFLTFTLEFPDHTSIDVATARKEAYPRPAALPVVSPAALRDDFQRRDFSVNAMALHLTPDRWGQWEDPFHGAQDMARGRLRVLHGKSFQDDPTRLFRAARYAGRYGWSLEPRTLSLLRAAVRQNLPRLLSPMRLRAELELILQEKNPGPALKLLAQWDALKFWEPAWRWDSGAAELMRVSGSDRVLGGLLALNRRSMPEKAQQALRRLSFPKTTVDAVSRTLTVYHSLRRGRLPPDPRELALPPVSGLVLARLLADKKKLRLWEASTPILSGEELRALGYAPGPLFQKIFERLRHERWRGRLRTRAQEIRCVVDNFPRKK